MPMGTLNSAQPVQHAVNFGIKIPHFKKPKASEATAQETTLKQNPPLPQSDKTALDKDTLNLSTINSETAPEIQANPFKEALSIINTSQSASEAFSNLKSHLNKAGIKSKDNLIEAQDEINPATLRFFKSKDNKGADQYLSWLAFTTRNHPELEHTLSQFNFPPDTESTQDKNFLTFERPGITHDRIKLTSYYFKAYTEKVADPEKGKGVAKDIITWEPELVELYAGKDFLITATESDNKLLNKAGHYLSESGKYKAPAEMVTVLLQNIIQHNSQTIHAFAKQLDQMSQTITENKNFNDKSISQFAELGSELFEINSTVLTQKAVIEDLLESNEFFQSPMIDTARYEQLLLKLNQQLDTLEHYQEHKNGLINLERAKASNQMDQSMKRLAAISTISIPPLTVAGFLGMNVLIPGSGIPWLFWAAVGGSTAASGGLFAVLKKKKWI